MNENNIMHFSTKQKASNNTKEEGLGMGATIATKKRTLMDAIKEDDFLNEKITHKQFMEEGINPDNDGNLAQSLEIYKDLMDNPGIPYSKINKNKE